MILSGNTIKLQRMKRILIVDDNLEATEILSRHLKKFGYESEIAYCGAEAMSQLQEAKYDMVISDVRMPNGSGIDLLREIKRNVNHIPIILTSADTSGAKAQAKALGADGFIAKPIDEEQLAEVIAHVIGNAILSFEPVPPNPAQKNLSQNGVEL
jgi:CheY-like chemotaxis protein